MSYSFRSELSYFEWLNKQHVDGYVNLLFNCLKTETYITITLELLDAKQLR